MRLDASACCDNSTLRAAAQRVADLATPVLHTVREICAAYTNVTIENFTRAQISGANPSGSPLVAGREHPVDPLACTVATRLGNLSCTCGNSIAADCKCLTLAYTQGAKMWLRPGDKLSGIGRVRDPPLLVAAADLARQLGLISDAGFESNIQVGRLMLYGIGGYKLDKDSELRDVTPDELAALVRQKNLASVVFVPGPEDRKLSDQPIDELLRIDVTPGQYSWYAFGGRTNAALVHYVTAGEGDADAGAIALSAHRDVDADCHTGST